MVNSATESDVTSGTFVTKIAVLRGRLQIDGVHPHAHAGDVPEPAGRLDEAPGHRRAGC